MRTSLIRLALAAAGLTLTVAAVAPLVARQSPTPAPAAGQPAVRPGAVMRRPGDGRAPEFPEPTITQYKPRTTLRTPQHLVPRAKFPVIDVHSHQPTPISEDQFATVVKGMDANNLRLLVNASGAQGERLTRAVAALKARKTPVQSYHEMWSAMLTGRPWKGTFINRRKDGTQEHLSGPVDRWFDPREHKSIETEEVLRLDPAVDLVISGHTHRAYVCRIDGRLVTSADKYGTLLGEIDLLLDRASGDVRESNARNVVVRTDVFAKDEAQTRLIEAYERLSAPLARRVVGRLAAPLLRDEGPAGESALGQVVADAQLAATADAGAQLALMNPGGLRAALTGDAQGTVRYEDLFAAQPFSNALVTITLTGAQLRQVLEQQWAGQARPRLLQVSRGLSYAWDAARPVGQRIVPGSLQLHGHTIAPEQRLRVTVNAYLAAGGDNFKALAENGADAQTGIMDIDALEQYFRRAGSVSPATDGRIRRLN